MSCKEIVYVLYFAAMIRPIKLVFSFTCLCILSIFSQLFANVQPPRISAGQAIIVDYDTGDALFEKNADDLVPPSSMSKLMTIYVLFDKIKNGQFKLDDMFNISDTALLKSKKMERERGSHMGIHKMKPGDILKVEDLIKGIIVLSGNDACVVVAENVSGSEEAFVLEMMKYAKKLGMHNTFLKNASGWEMDGHLMSVRDLSVLASNLITNFPDFYHYFSLRQFIYDDKTLWNSFNRNDLLRSQIGTDGLKTGHTDKGGYSVTSSIKVGERRFIIVVNGIKTVNGAQQRFVEVKKLFNWAYHNFDSYLIFNAGDVITTADVWFGKQKQIKLTVKKPVIINLEKGIDVKNIKATVAFNNPIVAPIDSGVNVGKLILTLPNNVKKTFDLVTRDNIKSLSLFGKFFENIRQLILSIVR